MKIQSRVDLRPYTTFGVEAWAESFVCVSTTEELRDALAWARATGVVYQVLGGGSNVLLTGDVTGLVILVRLLGREVSMRHDDVVIRCGAGESWHSVVTWTVENSWSGLENLALIPGTIGAAPMQNIGAYGTEQAACFVELDALDVATGEVHTYRKEECAFGYRDSVFKQKLRNKVIITSVTYRLSTAPSINSTYRDVADELVERGIVSPLVADIYDSVVAIRRRKLPDPEEIGNAGSFFKNPVVKAEFASQLQSSNPTLPMYPQKDGSVKLAAAWLIDQCGWKGVREGDAGVHVNQALVLVNYGNASGSQILDLATRIQASVYQKFNVELEREVNIW